MGYLYNCFCKEFQQRIGITIDTQDLRELGFRYCPYCKLPFTQVDNLKIKKSLDYVEIIRNYQAGLTPEQRVSFWNSLREGYCKECGYKEFKEPCRCWDDE